MTVEMLAFECSLKGCASRLELFITKLDHLAGDQRNRINIATQAAMSAGWLLLNGWTCPDCAEDMVDTTTVDYLRAVQRAAKARLIVYVDKNGENLKRAA